MWRYVAIVTVLAGSSISALAATPVDGRMERARAEVRAQQQERIDALAKRGRLSSYQQLQSTGKVSAKSAVDSEQADADSRDAAINLAALGFTSADVAAYRERQIDIFDMTHRLFKGKTSPAEQMLLADTVVVAKAGKVEDNKTRIDGFLSSIPFTVVRSIKGSRAAGDTIYLARESGKAADGSYVDVSSDIAVTPGKTYLLVVSKNRYEQIVAQNKKQAEVGFNALLFLAYEITANGALLPGPRPTLFGESPKDVKTAENDLAKLSKGKSKNGGT